MLKSRVIAAAAVALIGTVTLAGTTSGASADSVYFGIGGGGYNGGPAVGFGYNSGPLPPPYGAYRSYPAYRPYPAYRERPVAYCQDVWRTRRIHDQWGRVVKVVKVRDRECGPGWR